MRFSFYSLARAQGSRSKACHAKPQRRKGKKPAQAPYSSLQLTLAGFSTLPELAFRRDAENAGKNGSRKAAKEQIKGGEGK